MTTVTAIAAPDRGPDDEFTSILSAGYSLPTPLGHEPVDYDHFIALCAIGGQA